MICIKYFSLHVTLIVQTTFLCWFVTGGTLILELFSARDRMENGCMYFLQLKRFYETIA